MGSLPGGRAPRWDRHQEEPLQAERSNPARLRERPHPGPLWPSGGRSRLDTPPREPKILSGPRSGLGSAEALPSEVKGPEFRERDVPRLA